MSVLRKQIQDWFKNEVKVSQYIQGIEMLERSGIFTILQKIGTPELINYGASESVMASQGSWSNGYQQALEQIQHFTYLFQEQAEPVSKSEVPTFGGDLLALQKGDLTKEDLKDRNT